MKHSLVIIIHFKFLSPKATASEYLLFIDRCTVQLAFINLQIVEYAKFEQRK